MRDFIVILRSGVRFTVRARRIVPAHPHLALVLSDAPDGGASGPGDAVALFDQHEVLAILSRAHLVSEEQGQRAAEPHVVGSDDSAIPF
jgi:hypothetical protein